MASLSLRCVVNFPEEPDWESNLAEIEIVAIAEAGGAASGDDHAPPKPPMWAHYQDGACGRRGSLPGSTGSDCDVTWRPVARLSFGSSAALQPRRRRAAPAAPAPSGAEPAPAPAVAPFTFGGAVPPTSTMASPDSCVPKPTGRIGIGDKVIVNGRRGKITSNDGASNPYQVTFNNGKVSGWLTPQEVAKIEIAPNKTAADTAEPPSPPGRVWVYRDDAPPPSEGIEVRHVALIDAIRAELSFVIPSAHPSAHPSAPTAQIELGAHEFQLLHFYLDLSHVRPGDYVCVDGAIYQSPPILETPAVKAGAPPNLVQVRKELELALESVPRVPNCSAAALDATSAAALALVAIFGDEPHACRHAKAFGLVPLTRGHLVYTSYDAGFQASSARELDPELCREWHAVACLIGGRPSGIHLPLRGQPFIGKGSALGTALAGEGRGVLFHLGSVGGTRQYKNPHSRGAVVASMSSVRGAALGSPERFVENATPATPAPSLTAPAAAAPTLFNQTDNKPASWMAVDLGEGTSLYPERYCLRTDSDGSLAPSHWQLQGSSDGVAWVVLRRHVDEKWKGATGFAPFAVPPNPTPAGNAAPALAEASWKLEPALVQGRGFRHFRILQTGPNLGGTNVLACAGIELYGVLETSGAVSGADSPAIPAALGSHPATAAHVRGWRAFTSLLQQLRSRVEVGSQSDCH